MLLGIPAGAPAADTEAGNKRADELGRAARNYEVAADARAQTAEALLTLSRELRKKAHEDEKARTENLRKAGFYERQAGQLFFAACLGYEKAAAAWTRAAREHKQQKDQAGTELMKTAAEAATEGGTEACKRAAEAYEYSAEAFSDIDAGQMATSAEAAAKMRENLALRIK